MALTISKTKSAKWQVNVNHNGTQKRHVVGTKGAALEMQRLIEIELASYKLGLLESRRKKITFKELSIDWRAERYDQITIATQKRYNACLRLHILPKIGDEDIRDLELPDILNLLKGIKVKRLSTSLVKVAGSVISSVFAYAM